jgi:hypothetical protein
MRALTFLALALLTASCGGKVFVDGPTTSGGSGGSSSSGGGDPTACDALCNTLSERSCVGSGCMAWCSGAVASAGSCLDKLNAAIACEQAALAKLPDAPNACIQVGTCDTEFNAYETCIVNPKCGATQYSGNFPSFECITKAICNDTEAVADCDNQTGQCTCSLEGKPVGTCQNDSPFACDLYLGCCGPLIFAIDN